MTHKAAATGEFRAMLNDMSRHFGDHDGYPEESYQMLVSCLSKWDEPVLEAQDASWRLIYDIYISGGINDTKWETGPSGFLEGKLKRRASFGGYSNSVGEFEYVILEPCNYVSNIAAYNAALRACEYQDWNIDSDTQSNIVKSFAAGGQSAALFHGSMNNLGFVWDVAAAVNTLYIAYHILIQSVDDNPNFDVRLFRTGSREQPISTISETTNPITFLALNTSLPIEEWVPLLDSLPLPQQVENVVTLIAFGCVAVLPIGCCNWFLGQVIGPILLDESELDFLVNEYLPTTAIVAQNEGYPISPWLGLPLFKQSFGVLFSLGWAYLFQENQIPTPGLEGPIFNTTCLGAKNTPVVNYLGYLLHGISDPVPQPYNGKEEYPGAKYCNKVSPHALWHQEAYEGQLHALIFADRFNSVLQKQKERRQKKGKWFNFLGRDKEEEVEENSSSGRGWFGASMPDSFPSLRGTPGGEDQSP